MESEIIKKTFRLGNSAGVLLPIDWKDKKVRVQLIEKSINKEVIDILEEKDILKNTIGIFLAGSYARGEETESSDIDILVITDNIDKQLKIGKYEIILISKEKFEKQLKTSLYLISLVNESKAILNYDFIKSCKYNLKQISINKYLTEIKSMNKINEIVVEMDKELGENIADETIYSIVLRLRELYLLDCLKNGKQPSNREFINIVNKIANTEAYNSYLRIKNDLKPKKIVSAKEASALIDKIKKKIKHLENGKKN